MRGAAPAGLRDMTAEAVSPRPAGADLVVIGAGIVGIATALALRLAGREVLLVDRGPVGAETSHGNTGVLVESPWRMPGFAELLRRSPGILLGRSNAVRVAPKHVPTAAALLVRLMRGADRSGARALLLHQLQRRSVALHRQWIAAAGASDLLRATGWLKLFRTPQAAAAFAPDLDLLRRTGTAHRLLDAAAVQALEPALAPGCVGGVLLEDACSLSSPRALSQRYAGYFRRLGGRLARAEVLALRPQDGGWRLDHSAGSLSARQVVVAAGPWSADLLARMGLRLPLHVERGYHLHLAPGQGPELRRPVHDVAGGYVMTPQSEGVRVTSGVEIASRDAPADPRQIRRAVALAQALAGLGPPLEVAPWCGSRPCLPDGLPAIGPVPGRRGLWLNTGHHHIGLSLAAGSGDLLARMIAGTATTAEGAPFAPGRHLRAAPGPAPDHVLRNQGDCRCPRPTTW